MDYQIRLAAFEGPMDLLLHLIEKNKVDIYEVEISTLTQQYIDYINEAKRFDVEVAADFLVMAARLIQMKSRLILPNKTSTQKSDEANDEIDTREELVQKLLEYKKFQQVSLLLSEKFSAEEKYIKRNPLNLPQRILPPQSLSANKLLKTFLAVMNSNKELILPQVIVSKQEYTVKDKMIQILQKLESATELTLTTLNESKSLDEYLSIFLAILELVKRQKILVQQLTPFAEIKIIKNERIY